MIHVPFKGTSESVPALLGGHVDAAFAAYPNLNAAVATSNVKMLATNSAQRSPLAPDVPPLADFIPGFDFAPRVGLYARAGTPPELLAKISGLVIEIAEDPELAKQFAAAGIEANGAGGAEFKTALGRDSQHVAETVNAAGMKPQ
jgi:tripartite-type tricarboxylate transporter receptor subunit TctC